jgi:hypothetical protein
MHIRTNAQPILHQRRLACDERWFRMMNDMSINGLFMLIGKR